jgi:AcrR family transcriptional regulator
VIVSVTDKEVSLAEAQLSVEDRLRTAALKLFEQRGYDATTAAEIAAEAGVTERTFFRYFPDKREVLFDGEQRVRETLLAAIDDAPAGFGPLDILFQAFHAFQADLKSRRHYAAPRQALIAATPALQERELAKIAALAEALATALQAKAVAPLEAWFAAQAGMAAFTHATTAWLEDEGVDYAAVLREARHAISNMAK